MYYFFHTLLSLSSAVEKVLPVRAHTLLAWASTSERIPTGSSGTEIDKTKQEDYLRDFKNPSTMLLMSIIHD